MTMMRRFPFVVALVAVAGLAGPTFSQDAQQIIIKLKLFDSNQPKKELVPEASIITVRNQATGKGEVLRDTRFEEVPGEKGFFQAKLPKDRLLEKMVIYIDNSSGTDYNAATVSKLVTANNMVLYPGASNPADDFSFVAYTAQLNEYKAILTQLLDEFGESQGKEIREELRSRLGKQLLKMANAERRGKLSTLTPEQLVAARKLADEVLELYGLKEKEHPAAPTITIYACYPMYPAYPVYPCYPPVWQPGPMIYPVRWCR